VMGEARDEQVLEVEVAYNLLGFDIVDWWV